MNIDIILRTHDLIDIHPAREPRYCGVDKTTLIRKCVTSLVNTADNYEGGNIKFIWLDDHSSQITIDYLHDIFKKSKVALETLLIEELNKIVPENVLLPAIVLLLVVIFVI